MREWSPAGSVTIKLLRTTRDSAWAGNGIKEAGKIPISPMASLISRRLTSQWLRVASGKTSASTLVGSALPSNFPAIECLGLLARLVEQVTLNHRVGGSSPSQPTKV